MSVARFAAHPLVVAVALGLLAPPVLAEGDEAPTRDEGTATATPALDAEPAAIDPAELARVEREWLAVRDLESALSLSVHGGLDPIR